LNGISPLGDRNQALANLVERTVNEVKTEGNVIRNVITQDVRFVQVPANQDIGDFKNRTGS
jgi:hypothetical protein